MAELPVSTARVRRPPTPPVVQQWNDRLTKVSNRLTRYWWVSQRSGDDPELAGRRLVEARAGDLIFAAGAMDDCRRTIRRITRRLRTVRWPSGQVVTPSMDDFRILGGEAPARGYYEFHNMLWWGRSLLERIEGTWRERVEVTERGRRRMKRVGRAIGLLAFLSEEDAAQVRRLRDALRSGPFAEVKDLADYSLHAFVIPARGAMLRFTDDGVVLPLPDRLPGRLKLAQGFTFEEGRNVGTYADHLWLGVAELVDGVLDVIEAGQPRLEETLPADRKGLMTRLRADLMPPKGRHRRRR